MKKIVLILIGCFTLNAAFSQSVVFSEDFNYPLAANGDSMGTINTGLPIWNRHSGGGSLAKAVQYITTPLTLAGYSGSGIGGAVTFQQNTRSQDINGNIGLADSVGSLYASFLLKIDSAGGKDTLTDYFFHFLDGAGPITSSNFRARLFACYGATDSITKFRLGISKGTNAKLTAAQITAGAKVPQFTTIEYNVGQTYLVVLKYTFNTTGTKDDEVKLFVFPTGSLPVTEPVADITFTDAQVSDLARISSVCIRQGSIGRTLGTIDGIRVFTTWDAATIALLPNNKLNSFNAIGLKDVVNVNWSFYCGEGGSKFVVERSVDGINFNELSTSYTTSSKINCSLNYGFADKNLPNSTALYYRLKMIAANGSVEYSAIQKVKLSNIKLSVSPNPTTNDIIVNATKNITAIELYNVEGKKVYSLQNNTTAFVKIATATFANGTYIVKTIVDGETNSNTIIVKH